MAGNAALSKRIQEVALFTAANRNRSFVNMLTEQAPKEAVGDKNTNVQTSPHAPIVRISDLTKTSGESVDMQIVHKLSKLPTMGDKKLEGRGESLEFSEFDLKINQGRHMVDAGGKMAQQRTSHTIDKTGRVMLSPYFNDLQDQCATVHLAGARGDFMADDIILPLASHDEFAEIMINEITPPTYDRHFFGGDATSFESLDSADLFTLEVVKHLKISIEEMSNPLQPIKFKADELAGDEPFYLLNITPRQWFDWEQSSSYKDWQSLISGALTRGRTFKHPVFAGECAMYGNILVRKYKGMPIRFYSGSTVDVCDNDKAATVAQKTAGTTIDRAMLLGGQALANAWGKTDSGTQFKFTTKKVDHDNSKEISIAWMNGLKKIRFADKSGRVNDHGVIILDTAVNI